MKITTRNTVYTFKDEGDGAWRVSNRQPLLPEEDQGQDVLPVGTALTFLHEPKVGEILWGRKVSAPEGTKVGVFHTSTVREVEL